MRAEATPRDPNVGPLPVRMTGMASRFVARRFRRKVLALRNTPPMVTFTFDDVPASACETGARILEEHGGRGTFYVAGNRCGTADGGGPPLASRDQLRAVWAKGHEIGCHTYSHAAVRHVSLDELGLELDRNRAVLDTIDRDIVVRNFAYPYGDLSIRTKRYLEGRFDSCRSGHAGLNTEAADLGALAAWPLENISLDRAKATELIAQTVRQRAWLIFCSHDVAEPPSRFGVSPGLLEWTVSVARRSGCVLTTIAGALDLAGAETTTGRLDTVR